MTADKNVLDRIKRLLALATSDNEHEARAAAEKASELMLRHNLTQQQVKGDPEDLEGYGGRVIFEESKRTPQQKFIIPIVQNFFFVQSVNARQRRGGPFRLMFFGEQTNVEVAAYVHDFLIEKFPQCWREYQKRTGAAAGSRQSYWTGLMQGLWQQLDRKKKSVQTEVGLVLVKDPKVDLAVARQFPKLCVGVRRSFDRSDRDAHLAGHRDGEKLQVHQGLGSGTSDKAVGGKPLALGSK